MIQLRQNWTPWPSPKIVKASFSCWEKSDCHQPITRDGLKEIFGKEVSRDLIGRLHARGFIGTGSSLPR